MKMRMLVAIGVLGAVLTAAACGGGSSNKTIDNASAIANASPSASASASAPASPTVASSTVEKFGSPPVLGGNVTDVAPAYAASVKQSATRTAQAGNPSGVCADVNFNAPVASLQWFRMAVDGTEVTTKLTIIAHDTSSNATPTVETATLCYPPTEGLTVGIHSAAVSVQAPNDTSAAPVQTVAWKFEVTN